jgi:hypothetical protein
MKKELGVASLCIGGGMGIAVVVRALSPVRESAPNVV